ncbi:hypothetical protein KAR48_04575 [bacterium]|nr:hypothetical protein [bacterium]
MKIFFIYIFIFIAVLPVMAQPAAFKPIHAGIMAGVGLPKVPLNVYRPPVAITANVFSFVRFNHRFALQLTANALHSFSLGTASGKNSELKFNTNWATADLMIQLRGFLLKESFVSIGYGYYQHEQLFDKKLHTLNTGGLTLGMTNWNYHTFWATRFELRWHLLFEPSTRPQIVTATFGIMI